MKDQMETWTYSKPHLLEVEEVNMLYFYSNFKKTLCSVLFGLSSVFSAGASWICRDADQSFPGQAGWRGQIPGWVYIHFVDYI